MRVESLFSNTSCDQVFIRSLLLLLFPDAASADQQKAAGPHQDQDEYRNDDDVAMETEDQEEDLQAAEVQELKPEQLDSTKASQKGDTSLLILPIWTLNRISNCGFVKLSHPLTSPSSSSCRCRQWRDGGEEAGRR